MKKQLSIMMLLVLMTLVFSSCGTLFTKGGSDYRRAVSLYESKQYAQSIESLNKALALNPSFPEAVALYPLVFNEGTAYYKAEVANNQNREDRISADKVYRAYENLYDMHTRVSSNNRFRLYTEDFAYRFRQSREKAGSLWFAYAEQLAANNTRKSQREAVIAYETAKNRDPQIAGLDEKLRIALEKATVTLMVLGNGPDEAFHTMVLNDMKKTFSSDRFVQIIESESFRVNDPGVLVGPIDRAISFGKGRNIDYLIEVTVYNRTEAINKEEPVRLPKDNPRFSGVKKTVGYSIKNTVSYRLFDLKTVNVIAGNTFATEDGPYTYDFSYVKAEGLRELNLEGTGNENLRFVTSNLDYDTTVEAINLLRSDYSRIQVPYEVIDPTHQTQWYQYFSSKYNRFADLSRAESGRELFYALEVVYHRPSDSYFILGNTVAEAKAESNKNSAIMNALSHTARELINKEKDSRGSSYFTIGEEVGKLIRDVL